jgi:hypothetical protein
MSFTRTAKAVVVSCSLASSDQITLDLTVTLYQISSARAGIPVRRRRLHGDGREARRHRRLIDEEGTLMEHGKFSFDSTEEIAIETELEVEIAGIGSSTGIS